ncbi:putative lipid II flippase FtsW [Acidimicrobiaceae bacterium]|nr:putative lipid II flippase FtsW [Acidimicrobiaceae bacterium]
MSTINPGAGRTATLAERRRDVLEDRGITVSGRSSLGAPNATVFWILITVLSLITFGLVMVLSSSSIVALNRGMSPWRMFFKQLMWSSVGVLGMLLFYFFPYPLLRKFVLPGLIFAFGLMVLPFAPGIGVSTNGARAWVAIGPVGFQPSEFLKFALLVYCAHLLSKRHKDDVELSEKMKPILRVWLISVALCLVQKDLGGAIILTCIVLTLLFMAGTPFTSRVSTVIDVNFDRRFVYIVEFIPTQPLDGVHESRRDKKWIRVPSLAIDSGDFKRWHYRYWCGCRHRQMGLCATGSQRLYFLNHRRRVRLDWGEHRHRWISDFYTVRLAGEQASTG